MSTVHCPLTTSFWIDELPPSQNRLLRLHWTRRSELAKRWHFLVSAAARDGRGILPRFVGAVEVVMTFNVARQMDADNAQARAKLPLDALVRNHIIKNDDPSVLTQLTTPQNVVRTRKEHGVLIEIMEVTMPDAFPTDDYLSSRHRPTPQRSKAGPERGVTFAEFCWLKGLRIDKPAFLIYVMGVEPETWTEPHSVEMWEDRYARFRESRK